MLSTRGDGHSRSWSLEEPHQAAITEEIRSAADREDFPGVEQHQVRFLRGFEEARLMVPFKSSTCHHFRSQSVVSTAAIAVSSTFALIEEASHITQEASSTSISSFTSSSESHELSSQSGIDGTQIATGDAHSTLSVSTSATSTSTATQSEATTAQQVARELSQIVWSKATTTVEEPSPPDATEPVPVAPFKSIPVSIRSTPPPPTPKGFNPFRRLKTKGGAVHLGRELGTLKNR